MSNKGIIKANRILELEACKKLLLSQITMLSKGVTLDSPSRAQRNFLTLQRWYTRVSEELAKATVGSPVIPEFHGPSVKERK